MTIAIGTSSVGLSSKPYIVAEMSGNHNQSLDRALQIVKAAADSGADAIKLQTYTADTITLNTRGGSFEITDPDSLWKGSNLYDLYSKAYTPWEWHKPIAEYARELGIDCFSSPFDESAVDFLEENISPPAYKIASFENNHLPLIAKAAQTGKPLIISTGMASVADLDLAVSTARSNGCNELILLKCTSTYPASPSNTNLSTIPHIRQLFNCEVGLSDHTGGIGVAVASVAFGSTFIEKHFTLSRDDGGVDSAFSLEPNELASLVIESKRAWEAKGSISYGPSEAEVNSTLHRRSIYASSDIKVGEVFTEQNIKVVRPGDGLHPKYYPLLLGKVSSRDIKSATPLDISLFL